MHNLGGTEGIPIHFIGWKLSDCFDLGLIIKVDFFGKDININNVDQTKTSHFQNREEPVKSLMSCELLYSWDLTWLTKFCLEI